MFISNDSPPILHFAFILEFPSETEVPLGMLRSVLANRRFSKPNTSEWSEASSDLWLWKGDAGGRRAGRLSLWAAAVRGGASSGPGVMDRTAVVKVGAAASASVCALFGGVVLAQYIVAKKKRAGKKTRIIEMVSQNRQCFSRERQRKQEVRVYQSKSSLTLVDV